MLSLNIIFILCSRFYLCWVIWNTSNFCPALSFTCCCTFAVFFFASSYIFHCYHKPSYCSNCTSHCLQSHFYSILFLFSTILLLNWFGNLCITFLFIIQYQLLLLYFILALLNEPVRFSQYFVFPLDYHNWFGCYFLLFLALLFYPFVFGKYQSIAILKTTFSNHLMPKVVFRMEVLHNASTTNVRVTVLERAKNNIQIDLSGSFYLVFSPHKRTNSSWDLSPIN